MNVIIPQLDGNIRHFTLLGSVVDDQLGLHALKCHHEEDQATRGLTPILIICVDERALLGMEGVLDCPGGMILQNEVEGPTDLPETNLVSIHVAQVSGLIWIYGIKLHVIGLSEGGSFVAHKKPKEGADLI